MCNTRDMSHVQNTRKSDLPVDNETKERRATLRDYSPTGTHTAHQEHISAPAVLLCTERAGEENTCTAPATHARGAHTEMRNRPSEEAVTMAWRVCANSLLIAHSQGKRRRKEAFSAVRVRGRGWAQRERVGEQHVHGSSSLQMAVCPLLFAMESAVDPELFLISFLAPASSSARTT